MAAETARADGSVDEIAPAKINLALHVTGQRSDGYHLLDSIVTFARAGDGLTFAPSEEDRFSLCGRFGPMLAQEGGAADNLVLRARDLLRAALDETGRTAPPVAITLEKNLPVASGIGGGSADAAAALRGLMRLWGAEPEGDRLAQIALRLGADVPMCLVSRPLRATGIGEALHPLDRMPAFAMVLANPLKAVSTPDIFRRLTKKDNPPAGPAPHGDAARDWLDWLAGLRNDLEPPARALLPEIADMSDLLAREGARLVRMSGSGATCFGLFGDFATARQAANTLSQARPGWYLQATETIAGEPS